jgi:hypothetical protein
MDIVEYVKAEVKPKKIFNKIKFIIIEEEDEDEDEENEIKTEVNIIVNKGTGAGGAKTNYYGKQFEDKTNNQTRLLNDGYILHPFTKKACYLSKTFEDKTIIFALQNGLKYYLKYKYNIDLFRCPDEAYLIEYNTGKKVIKILEKKEQNVEGSIEMKLWSGPSMKREYEFVLGKDFEVYYGFCVSQFLKIKLTSKDKKYCVLNAILNEYNIVVLFGDDDDYFKTLDNWIHISTPMRKTI